MTAIGILVGDLIENPEQHVSNLQEESSHASSANWETTNADSLDVACRDPLRIPTQVRNESTSTTATSTINIPQTTESR
jgi:hypothetical protein